MKIKNEQRAKKKGINKKLTVIIFLIIILIFSVTCSNPEDDPNHMINLEPLKDQFYDYFGIGNIFSSDSEVSGRSYLLHHYNFVTAENNMKPSYLNPSRNNYNFNTANSMVNAALNSGLKVVGHTLLWHSQIPEWQEKLRNNTSITKETAIEYMKKYITDVVTNFKDKIYSWDVINEAFPDGGFTNSWKTSMRSGSQGNPWFMRIGSDFVYEGFKAARLADPNAILYYNDYNLNQSNKATMVRDMVKEVNENWKNDSANTDKNRLLIEGIGMQSHHNTGVQPSSIKASLDLFRPLDVVISISELDVLSQSWNEYSSNNEPTEQGKQKAAELYGEYFKLFLENHDIIERVTFWGLKDDLSWRARALPLIFDARGVAKPAYFKIIGALEAYKNKNP
ncbi:MAG: endo-1,4-beta-xylanase [Treponema sp.]|nr:endo-1,4-beta-xylanase [Treponema sp.]